MSRTNDQGGFLRAFLGILPDGPDDTRPFMDVNYLAVRGNQIVLPNGPITITVDDDDVDDDAAAQAVANVLNAIINLIAHGFTTDIHGGRSFGVGIDALHDLDATFVALFEL